MELCSIASPPNASACSATTSFDRTGASRAVPIEQLQFLCALRDRIVLVGDEPPICAIPAA